MQEEGEEEKPALERLSHKAAAAVQTEPGATPLERIHNEALSSSEIAKHNAKPKVDLLHILQQGWDLRSVCTPACCSCWQPSPSSLPSSLHPPFPLLPAFSRRNMRCTEAPAKRAKKKSWPPFHSSACFDQPFLSVTPPCLPSSQCGRLRVRSQPALRVSLEFHAETTGGEAAFDWPANCRSHTVSVLVLDRLQRLPTFHYYVIS